MKKLLYYSDCHFFAGCEQMLAVLINSGEINSKYSIKFVYRYSKEYYDGMISRIHDCEKTYGIHLYDPVLSSKKSKFLQINIIKKIMYLILKYPVFIINTIKLYQCIRKENYDLVHINNGGYPAAESVYSMVVACKLASIKTIIYIVNNQAVEYNSFKRIYDYPLDYIIKKQVTLFITSSVSAKEKLKEVLHINDNKVININNGILLRKIDQSKLHVRKMLNVDKKKVIVGIVANIEDRKGIIYAIKAFELLIPEKNILLVIEGEGPVKNELLKYIFVNKISNVMFIEKQKNIMNFINAIDIFLLPSISNEDFPNVILEAMSFGKAIIATNIAGIPEQITHLEDGIIINPESSGEIAANVLTLAQNFKLRNMLGHNAKMKFIKNYTSEIAVKKYIKLYNELMDLKGKNAIKQ